MMRILSLILAALLFAGQVQAASLETIRARKTLVVGVKDGQAPFGFRDPQSGEVVGFDIDLAKALAEGLGVAVVLKPVANADRISAVKSGHFDMVLATTTRTRARETDVDFSVTYFVTEQRLLVRKDSGIRFAADLKGKRVGTARGSTAIGNIGNAEPAAEIVLFESIPLAFAALQAGGVAAVVTDEAQLVGVRASAANPDDYAVVGEALSYEPYAVVLPDNQSALRDAVNHILHDLWVSGRWKTIYDRWFGRDTPHYIPLQWKMEVWP